jgi:GNAT superfamily N-acetyltransferase
MAILRSRRTYLQLLALEDLTPSPQPRHDAIVRRIESCPPELYLRLYKEVGRDYHWIDRLEWTDADIRRHLANPGVSFWVLEAEGRPAGYFELVRQDDGSIEIGMIGLLPAYIGQGLGGYLLTVAVQQAFADGTHRVWLHTSILDHRAALPNYLRRGFTPYKEEEYTVVENTTAKQTP